jgi:hypothetical protein
MCNFVAAVAAHATRRTRRAARVGRKPALAAAECRSRTTTCLTIAHRMRASRVVLLTIYVTSACRVRRDMNAQRQRHVDETAPHAHPRDTHGDGVQAKGAIR